MRPRLKNCKCGLRCTLGYTKCKPGVLLYFLKGETMKGYTVSCGYMGYIPGKGYRLYATEDEYIEDFERRTDEYSN